MLPLIAYTYAIGSLLCLAVVVSYEFRRKLFAKRIEAGARFKFDPHTAPSPDTHQAARQKLTQACRQSMEYRLAHFSLGRDRLD